MYRGHARSRSSAQEFAIQILQLAHSDGADSVAGAASVDRRASELAEEATTCRRIRTCSGPETTSGCTQ